jgi:hypothetical protein
MFSARCFDGVTVRKLFVFFFEENCKFLRVFQHVVSRSIAREGCWVCHLQGALLYFRSSWIWAQSLSFNLSSLFVLLVRWSLVVLWNVRMSSICFEGAQSFSLLNIWIVIAFFSGIVIWNAAWRSGVLHAKSLADTEYVGMSITNCASEFGSTLGRYNVQIGCVMLPSTYRVFCFVMMVTMSSRKDELS